MKEIYSNSGLQCRVFEDEKTGKLFLETVCGGFAMTDVTVPLTQSEISDFKIDPDRIKHVVRDVTLNPDKAVKDRGGWFGDIGHGK